MHHPAHRRDLDPEGRNWRETLDEWNLAVRRRAFQDLRRSHVQSWLDFV